MESECRVYRPRNPRKTPLWGLLDTLYERVKGKWEERFERKYGFWRRLADEGPETRGVSGPSCSPEADVPEAVPKRCRRGGLLKSSPFDTIRSVK